MLATFRVGTSGWNYAHWRDVLYPRDLPQRAWLEHYAQSFDTVEINNSFYMLPKPASWEAWRRTAPPGFVFAVKGSRLITHMCKLKTDKPYLATFLEHAALLGDTLGPILFQMPHTWSANVDRLRTFLDALPRGGRYAFEFRHDSWLAQEVLDLLRRHGVAFCCWDMEGREWPVHVTADFAYVRFHGRNGGRYAGRYTRRQLQTWADTLQDAVAAAGAREVWVYFNNDLHGHAIANAREFRDLVGAVSTTH